MLNKLAAGNPGLVAHTITWNGSIVYHQPILTNTLFALIQFLIGFGIVWKTIDQAGAWRSRSCGPSACGGSAKGRGGVFHGRPRRSEAVPVACSSMPSLPSCCGRAKARTGRSWPHAPSA